MLGIRIFILADPESFMFTFLIACSIDSSNGVVNSLRARESCINESPTITPIITTLRFVFEESLSKVNDSYVVHYTVFCNLARIPREYLETNYGYPINILGNSAIELGTCY